MPANRIEAASKGYSSMVESTPVEWVLVGLLGVVVFFVGGYLLQQKYMNHLKNKRHRQ